jgi:hypothetical protein
VAGHLPSCAVSLPLLPLADGGGRLPTTRLLRRASPGSSKQRLLLKWTAPAPY